MYELFNWISCICYGEVVEYDYAYSYMYELFNWISCICCGEVVEYDYALVAHVVTAVNYIVALVFCYVLPAFLFMLSRLLTVTVKYIY